MNGPDKQKLDSEFCGSLPLHLINLVQPYGVLLVLNNRMQIVQVSENISEVFPVPPEKIIDTPFSAYISAEQHSQLQVHLASHGTEKLPFSFTIANDKGTNNYQALVHHKQDYTILEIDKSPKKAQSSFIEVFQPLKQAISVIEQATDMQQVCDAAIQELKKLSGFDRIMVYQFDEDWNGVVMAEVLEPGMDPYIRLRFPASDIPRQARELYRKNPYRLIPSRDYRPVRLYPVINPITGAFIDLSDCNLRSVAAVHLEYLKNMNVTASMSTRIIVNNNLWGLISCHHRTEKYLDYEMCSLFELMSAIISGKITSIQSREEFSFNSRLKDLQSSLVKQVYESNDLYEGMFNREISLLELLNAGGAAMVTPRQIRVVGHAPSKEQIREMVYWLQNNPSREVYHVTNLSAVYEPGQSFTDVASGVIVLPIDPKKGEYIIGFRPEVVQEVNWGGNPGEAINFEKDNITYHPRNSFRQWQQLVKNTSLPWLPGEVLAAEGFRNFVWNKENT